MNVERLLSSLHVQVDYFAVCEISEGWRLALPGPAGEILHFVLRGHGVVRSSTAPPIPLRPSTLAIVPRGCAHSLETAGDVRHECRIDGPPPPGTVAHLVAGSEGNGELIVACGVVHTGFSGALGLFDRLHKAIAADLSETPSVAASIETILHEQAHPGLGSTSLVSSLLHQCLVHFLRSITEEGTDALLWLNALNDSRLEASVDLILTDPGAPHTVDSLARVSSMSRSAFAEHFAAAFGQPPMNVVNIVRMQRAAALLSESEIPIEEIAHRVGFSSRSHFSQAFKRHVGVTPAAYRVRMDGSVSGIPRTD